MSTGGETVMVANLEAAMARTDQISRRMIVRGSAKLAYAAPIIAASSRLHSASAQTVVSGPGSTCPAQIDPGPPTRATITLQDATTGLASIVVTLSENADTVLPPLPIFPPTTLVFTGPVLVTATKIDQTKTARVSIQMTNGAGTVSQCSTEF
jgi:hypothetical protein